jgi:hypothetical protein
VLDRLDRRRPLPGEHEHVAPGVTAHAARPLHAALLELGELPEHGEADEAEGPGGEEPRLDRRIPGERARGLLGLGEVEDQRPTGADGPRTEGARGQQPARGRLTLQEAAVRVEDGALLDARSPGRGPVLHEDQAEPAELGRRQVGPRPAARREEEGEEREQRAAHGQGGRGRPAAPEGSGSLGCSLGSEGRRVTLRP